MIEILMTATRRPEIVERTLESFVKNFFGRSLVPEIIINIDPVGPGTTEDVISVVKRYCDIKALITPRTANFSRAFKRVWSLCESLYCLWLEDDWELKLQIDINDMLNILVNNPYLATLRLPWVRTERTYMKNWKYKFPLTIVEGGRIFKCPDELKREIGFCGHPSLINGSFIRQCAPFIDPGLNPEKQFHVKSSVLMDIVDNWSYGVYAKPNQPAAVEDIGRRWMVEQGLKKKGNKAWFQEWEEEEQSL